MAGREMRGGVRRSRDNRSDNTRTYTYVDGTAVRKTAPAVRQMPQDRPQRTTSAETKQNRERALSMNLGYVLFLTAAAVVSVCMCVNFLQLRVTETTLQKRVTAKEVLLEEVIRENDDALKALSTSVDLEHVKDVAMNEYGMVYAKKSQFVEYDAADGDYVRKYVDVPTE